MELKEGFKETEVGIIPEDWQVHILSDIVDTNRSIRYGIVQPGKYETNGCLMLRSQDYSKGWSNSDEMHRVSSIIESLYKNARICEGDLIMTVVGAGIGQVVIAPDWLHNGIVSRSTARIAVDKRKAAKDFVIACLTSSHGKRQILNVQKEGAQPVVSCLDLAKFRIPFPPLAEQTAIASALSDTEALINSLEKLIAKKRNIKQGAMQQLLTGKKRLPGFAGTWEEKKFKDVTNLITCGIAATPEYVSEGNGFPFLSSTNVKNGKIEWCNFKYVSKGLHTLLYKNNPPLKGDILYSRVGTIGEAAIVDVDFEFSVYVSLTLIKVKSVLNNRFLKHLLNSSKYKNLANREVLMGGGVGNLNVNVVREFLIDLPPVTEQEKIADILDSIDVEINNLEKKLEKYKNIKQGMMHMLLTGKIRLGNFGKPQHLLQYQETPAYI